jgi:hypothetical protein
VSTHPMFSRSDPEFSMVLVDKHVDPDPMAPEVYSNANLYFYVKVPCSAVMHILYDCHRAECKLSVMMYAGTKGI